MKSLKLTFGLRTAKPVFRFATWSGSLIDDLLANVEKSKDNKNIFKNVEHASDKSFFRLVGDTHTLIAGLHDVQLNIDHYESKLDIDMNKEAERFITFFNVINASLKIRDIRRIGLVCEYRKESKTEQPSRELIEKVTKLTPDGYPAKFQLQFEQRQPITASTGIPDFKTGDFWNIIETYYDAENDTNHSAKRALNLMLDVQRYYKPFLEEKIDVAINELVGKYRNQQIQFDAKAKNLGLINGN